jgi:hypothetical protein
MYLVRPGFLLYLHRHGSCSLTLAQHSPDGLAPSMTAAAHGRSASGSHCGGGGGPAPDARHTVVQGAASTATRSRSWSAYTFMGGLLEMRSAGNDWSGLPKERARI